MVASFPKVWSQSNVRLLLVVISLIWAASASAQEVPAAPEAAPEAEAEPEAAPALQPETPEPAPPPPAAREEWVLLFTSDLEGTLVDGPCDENTGAGLLLPQVAAAVTRERQRAADEGLQPPVVLDAGDALFPSPLVNELGEDPQRAGALAQALRRAGYDALAIGDLTMSAPPRGLLGLMGATQRTEVPMLVSNLACPEDAEESCQQAAAGQVAHQTILIRGDLRIGVINLLPEAFAGSIPSRTLSGAELTVALEAARARIRALRADGVDAVVLISQLDTERTAPRNTLELLSELEGADRPDVVLAASTSGMALQVQAPAGGPPLLATPAGTLGRAVLRRVDGRWTLVGSSSEELPAAGDPALGSVVQGWHRSFCQVNARPLTGGELDTELDRQGFAQLVLRALREQTHAEIAFINRRAISEAAFFPMSGRLTAARVQRALPYPAELRVATIRGSDIGTLAGTVLDSPAAYSAGIERRDNTLYINGREVNPDGRYRVVTTRFVARGGDGILGGDGVLSAEADHWEEVDPPAEGITHLDDRVIHWLDSERGAAPYDPEEPLDLYGRPLWYGSLTLDANVSFTAVRDDNYVEGDDGTLSRRYQQAQLNRQGVLDLRGSLEGRFGLSTRGHAWDNLLRLRYGRQRLETEIGSGDYEWAESVDLISFRSAYDMDYLRDVVLGGAWYGPSIFIEYNLESEFFHERAPDDTDSPHFLEMTGLLGLKLKPNTWFRLSVAGGIRSMVTAPDPYPLPGLNLRAEIMRTLFSDNPRLPIYVAAYIDYFVGWPVAVPDIDLAPVEGSAVHKLTGELRLELTLIGPLRLTGSLRGFLYDENPGTVAMALDATVGLSVALSDHTQMF